MAKSTSNMELVPQEVLNELKALDSQLDTTKNNLKELLNPVVSISNELQKSAKNYKDLTELINAFNKVEGKANEELDQHRKHLTEIQKLQQKVVALNSREAKEIAGLKEVIRQKNQENKESVRLANVNANSIEALRIKVSELKREWAKMDTGSEAFKNMSKQIDFYNQKLRNAEKNIGVFGRNVGNYPTGFGKELSGIAMRYVSVGAAVAGVVGAVKDGVKTIKEFEQANANLASILGKTKEEILSLTESAKDLGATTEYTASDVTRLQTELAKLGFNDKEIMNMQKSILQFSTAMGAELPEAAALAGASLRAFGMNSTEAERALAVMANGANKSALSFSYLETSMSIVAPVAKTFGFSIEDTVSLLGALADVGFDASSAATATRNILLNLADSNGKLAKSLGKPVNSIDSLVSGLKELNSRGIDLAATLELTDKRSVSAFNAFLDGADHIAQLRDGVSETDGVLEKIQKDRLNTLEGSIKQLNSAWEGLILTFSDSSGPMKEVVDGLTGIISKITDLRKNLYEESTAWRVIWESASFAITSLFDLIKVNLKSAATVIASTLSMIGYALTGNFSEAKEEFKRMNEQLGSDFKSYWNKTTHDVSSAIGNIFKKESGFVIVDDPADDLEEVERAVTKTTNKIAVEDEKLQKKRERIREKDLDAYNQSLALKEKSGAEANKRIVQDDRKSYEERIEALNNYTSALQASVHANADAQVDKLIRDTAIGLGKDPDNEKDRAEVAKMVSNQIILIRLKEAQEKEKIAASSADMQNKIEEDRIRKELLRIKNEADLRNQEISGKESQEYSYLAEDYSKGLIPKEVYEAKKLAISQQYAQQRYENEKKMLQDQLNLAGLTEEEELEIKKRLADADAEYTKYVNDQKIASAEKLAEKQQELAQATYEFMDQLVNQHFENQLKKLEEEAEANEEWTQNEMDRIGRLEESGAISKEQAEARKKAVDDQAQAREAQIEKEKKEILRKQAIYQRAMSIAQVSWSTAQGIMNIWAQMPPYIAPAMTAVVAALGAVQIASILATPIPEYAKGTEDHPGGLAIVGDGGKSEMIIANGQIFKTPSTDTLVDLPKHSIVLPDFKAEIGAMKAPDIPVVDRVISFEELSTLLKEGNQKTDTLVKMLRQNAKNEIYERELNKIKRISR